MLSRLLVCAAACVALGLLGCKGATLPATNITSTGAKLNLQGEADKGAAFSYFEYWQTAVPGLKSKTTVRNWPAGAQGPFGDRANGLRQATSYTFRACGNDTGKPATCVNTRSFTTGVSGYSGIAHTNGLSGYPSGIGLGCGDGTICVSGGSLPAGFPGPAARGPSWSPDATKIAFEHAGKLWVWDVASGTSARLGNETIIPGYPGITYSDGNPDWSPDGTKIAVDNGIIRASDGARLSTADTRNPAWSPDGTKLAYECGLAICVDGQLLTHGGLEPAWSPDGTKIAFSSYRDSTACTQCRVIVVMNADGTNQTQLTFITPVGSLPNSDRSPSWSPSGTQVAFQSSSPFQPNGQALIKVVNAGGGTPVTQFEGGRPDWSPRP